jgi:hypothetical protein
MNRSLVRPVARRRSILLLALLAACGGGGRDIVDPPPPPDTDFTLTVRAHADDAAVAQQLGWSAGLPGTEVTIAPADGSGPGQVLTTAIDGTVTLDALAPGDYRISARRLLTSAEVARLGAGSSVAAFAGEAELNVSASTRTATVQLPASHRRSLVISEWAFRRRTVLSSGTYLFGGYLELYNNADTTVYLDGVLVGDALGQAVSQPAFSCELTAPFRTDPAGIWTQELAAFPGTGRQYPLAPGATAVVAIDAIDHSVLLDGMLDLRGADFEFLGQADVDNPTVPNMIDHSLSPSVFGHGIAFMGFAEVAVLGRAVPTATLHRGNVPPSETSYYRIDRDDVLDVFATTTTYYLTRQPPLTLCDAMVNVALDRKHGFFLEERDDDYLFSMSRKVLATLPDGRKLLQHTRTSASDFQRTPRTPGTVQ